MMRCPNCQAPVPAGATFCLDCGARQPALDWDPWNRERRETVRRNTGEQVFRQNQRRQARHEELHTVKAAADGRSLREHRPGQPTPKEKRKNSGGILRWAVPAFVLFYLLMMIFDALS
ncbi:MAG: zinc ribbon domain-containing protein [Oscillospiraceae bacterium]|nr:zinc ribbon domain-containing protein [Oscillospiraceae bacterium]